MQIGNNQDPCRFWETDHFFKCPVIGTCLSITEQKRLLKKEGISVKEMGLFEIHEALVGSSEKENSLSRRIDLWLNRKFKREIDAFFGLSESEFMGVWKGRFRAGDIEAIFWVAAIRSDLSIMARRTIFGDIHMQMHLNARQGGKERQQLACRQKENQKLDNKLREAASAGRSLRKENERLKGETEELRKAFDSLKSEKQELERGVSEIQEVDLVDGIREENEQLQAELKKLLEQNRKYQQQIKSLEDKNNHVLSKLDKQREMNGHLRKEMEIVTTQILALNRCDETCPAFDLCRKRILIVGGITKMEFLYRQLIEENGGTFEYHDGYMNRGSSGLENRVRRADVVLCPVNCNSHTACLMVKKLGKKYDKPVEMLSGSSVNAISQALQEYREGAPIQ